MLRGFVLALGVDPKARGAFRGAGRAEPHLGANRQPASTLDRLIRRLPCFLKFCPGVGGRGAGLQKSIELSGISKHLKEVHHVAVQIVVDLAIRPWLLEQHAGSAAEGLDVGPVWREMLNNPRRNPELAAVIPQYGTVNHGNKPPSRCLVYSSLKTTVAP